MRVVSVLLAGILGVVLVVAGQRGVAEASFHCMRIHAVMAGFDGDPTVQYVELRMNAGFQNLVAGKTIQFRDSAGTLKATFTFPMGNPTNAATGDSILIATSEFNTSVVGGVADYTFAGNTTGANGGNPLYPVQGPGGKVEFAPGADNCDAGFVVGAGEVDSLAYGGATADFGSAAAALPSPSTNQALRLNNINLAPSNNMTEYGLASVSTSTFSVAQANLGSDLSTPRNNGRVVLKLVPPGVGGVAQQPDVAALGQLAAPSDDGDRNQWLIGLVAVSAAAVVAGAGAWYRRRRRVRAS